VFHRRQLDGSSSFRKAQPFLSPYSLVSGSCSRSPDQASPQLGGIPTPRPWISLSACMATGAGQGPNRSLSLMGLALNGFAQDQAAPGGSRLCSCHWLTGCQAAGSECPRRGCDKRQAIVPSFPPRLQGSNLLLLENGSRAPYLIPGPGGWTLRKGSCFVERLPLK